MKIIPLLPLILVSTLIVPIVQAKGPEPDAAELAQRAKEFLDEAKAIEERAAGAEKDLSRDLLKYADLTRKESENLLKASQALENNQRRLAGRYMERAAEYCHERGEYLEKVYPQCEEKEEKALKAGDKEKTLPTKTADETGQPGKPEQEKTPRGEAERLQGQISELGQ